jgi:serine/threonine protein kinase
MWSLGVLLYYLICGFYPFDSKNQMKLSGLILNGKINIKECIPKELKNILCQLLEKVYIFHYYY